MKISIVHLTIYSTAVKRMLLKALLTVCPRGGIGRRDGLKIRLPERNFSLKYKNLTHGSCTIAYSILDHLSRCFTYFPKFSIVHIFGLILLSGCATKSTDYLLLDAVNREVNQVQYKMTPAKSVDDFYANGGNCRNFAEAKYSKLLDAGFTDDDMRFTYFWHKGGNQMHTTLEVQADDTVYVLDNMYSWLGEADGYYNMPVHRASYAEAKNSIWWGR